MYDEYGEVIMEDDGYYYSPHGPEVLCFHIFEFLHSVTYVKIFNYGLNSVCAVCVIQTSSGRIAGC